MNITSLSTRDSPPTPDFEKNTDLLLIIEIAKLRDVNKKLVTMKCSSQLLLDNSAFRTRNTTFLQKNTNTKADVGNVGSPI